MTVGQETSAPPSFEEARNRRQKARSAGLDPNYWYAVELSSRLHPGQVTEVTFWKRSIAVFRGEDGRLRAVENRCAHRQLKLTEGVVQDCKLVCPYHGWQYDAEGRAHIPHDTFGHKKPNFRIATVPVKERYGLIFVFPGDPALATVRDVPEIPELEGPSPWAHAFVRLDCPGHHSMLLDNVSDFTHGFLHRKYQPFGEFKLLDLREEEDRVTLEYESKIAAGPFQDMFIDRSVAGCEHQTACYEYPYHWSNTDGKIKHYLFTLPIDEKHNRHIFIFYLSPDLIKIPVLNRRFPRFLQQPLTTLAGKLIMTPLLSQDVWVIGHEQDAYDRHWDAPVAEVSPVVKAFQDLTIRKWEQYLAGRDLTSMGAKSESRAKAS
jgi:4beta-methylsterol monooxygenase